MFDGIAGISKPDNEPVRSYAPGSPEKASLKAELQETLAETVEIPLVIGGKEVRTGSTGTAVCPHDRRHVLATFHKAGEGEVAQAIAAASEAWAAWSQTPWEERAAVLLRAAELLAGPWRDTVNAACMLNQSKTVHQAEIDAACELADFWRFNPRFARFIHEQQPQSVLGQQNSVEYRPLEGFVLAVSPFNFASIAGNLPTAPALMGNTVLWKPASSAVVTAYQIIRVLQAAGLPDGVINFLPGSGSVIGAVATASPTLAGIHFTGSNAVFNNLWTTVGNNISSYRSYPRLVGETGGKGFVFAHASADVAALATALVRGAFEYQGQKCSAASRAYIPRSIWPRVREQLLGQLAEVRMGSPLDFTNFMCAVIDRSAFRDIMAAVEYAKGSSEARVIYGGNGDDSVGYFIQPTVVVTTDPHFKLMEEELFGPVLTVFVYDDSALDQALELVDTTSPYALTGSIFAEDRSAIAKMMERLRHAAGNFYVNDKPTGAVVGQQPFGGSRGSGTNDKAGSYLNLIRWTSPRTIKENFSPSRHFAYPFMAER